MADQLLEGGAGLPDVDDLPDRVGGIVTEVGDADRPRPRCVSLRVAQHALNLLLELGDLRRAENAAPADKALGRKARDLRLGQHRVLLPSASALGISPPTILIQVAAAMASHAPQMS